MKNTETKLTFKRTVIATVISCCIQQYACAEGNGYTNPNDVYNEPGVSQTDFGGVGLLQTPTARMAETGEFSANYRDNEQYRRYALSLQVTDWLETTIRYTDIRTRLYSNNAAFSGDQTYKDKGFDLKLRAIQESYWLPQVSLGLRDIAGTGLFDSEYIVANKKAGPFDFSLGIGWGNMAESGNITNPLCKVSDGYCTRTNNNETGQFEVKNFFHGSAALFGGIEYQTPWNPLRIKLEYDGNDYSHESAGYIKQVSPFNFGIVYRAYDALDTTLSYQRGNTLMWGFTLRTNFNQLKPWFYNDVAPTYAPKSVASIADVDWQKVSQELDQYAGYQHSSIYAEGDTVAIHAKQVKYRDKDVANQRAATIISNHTPSETKILKVVEKSHELPVAQTNINLDAYREQKNGVPLGQSSPVVYKSTQLENIKQPTVYKEPKDRINFGIEPTIVQSFGGPESFYMYQIGAKANTDLNITDHWTVNSTLNLNVANNYDKFSYTTPPSDTTALPRVRTWIREYVTSSDLLLSNLQLTRMDNPATDWYSQAYAGYLELMYAGVGSEVLYRPYDKSWAIGLDGNYVKQRDWNDTLQLADYDTFTGHLTTYLTLPFMKGGMAKVSVGQYLAGDKGVTLDLSKRFDSGIVAGAFITKTNVSAADYGEGSFTKGFYISVPLDLTFVHPTPQKGTVSWVPLTRDGGQKLSTRYSLYEITNRENKYKSKK